VGHEKLSKNVMIWIFIEILGCIKLKKVIPVDEITSKGEIGTDNPLIEHSKMI
jgi:hypothetical protein